MYWELRKKMPEIIAKASQKAAAEAVAEAVPKAVAEAVPKAVEQALQKERTRFKQFCEKHGIEYTEEDWTDDTYENRDE